MTSVPTSSAQSPPSPWRNLRWLFPVAWLVFLGYPVAGVIRAETGTGWKAVALLMLAVLAVVYILLSVYAMFTDVDGAGGADGACRTLGRGLRNAGIATLVAILVGLLPIVHTGAFSVAPYLMAAVLFAAPWRVRYALLFVLILIGAAILIPEVAGWELDTGFLLVMVVVGITMGFSRVMSDAERVRDRAAQQERQLKTELAVSAERERVARDVHDILGHSLTVITVKSELAERLIDRDPERARAEIGEVNTLARDALAQVRSTVGNLQTPELPSVVAAAASALAASGIEADLADPSGGAGPHATTFAWVLREAVTNVVRHSGAARCTLTLTPTRIVVADDGVGSALLTYGNGLRGLAERVTAAGGRLRVDSDGSGTAVTADFGVAR